MTINGKEYELKKIDFKALVKLEKLGLTIPVISNIEDNYWGALSVLMAYIMGDKNTDRADVEIEQHIENGGSLDDFTQLFEMLTKSDFFMNLSKQPKTANKDE